MSTAYLSKFDNKNVNIGEYILQIKIHQLWIHGDKMKNKTMNKYEEKLDGVTASAEVGEGNVVAVITDNRSTTRTTFEQRTGIDQNKLASMVWNIGMDSILNAASMVCSRYYKTKAQQSHHLFNR